MEHWNKSLNFIFPTKYVIPKSLKFGHWPSKLTISYLLEPIQQFFPHWVLSRSRQVRPFVPPTRWSKRENPAVRSNLGATTNCVFFFSRWKQREFSNSLRIQSPSQMVIGVYSHLLSKVFRFHYHSQKVIGSLGIKFKFMDYGWKYYA